MGKPKYMHTIYLRFPFPFFPPASPCCVTCTKCILDLLTTTHFDYIRCQAATGKARGYGGGEAGVRHLLVCLIGFVFILVFNYI